MNDLDIAIQALREISALGCFNRNSAEHAMAIADKALRELNLISDIHTQSRLQAAQRLAREMIRG